MRFVAIGCLLLAVAFAAAQSPTDKASAWIVGAWKTVKREGKTAADRVVKESPARFRDLKKQALTITKTCQNGMATLDLDGRKRVVEQLWRVRSSLNLLALANPSTLSVVGIDPDQVTAMMGSVNAAWTGIAKQYPSLVKPFGK